jgi:hypothetical protein
VSGGPQRFRKTELDRICEAVKRHGVTATVNPITGCVELRPSAQVDPSPALTEAERAERQMREAFGE